jgi:aryl-alcohol dehydrogenase-like predicted oxidoreductase
VSDLPRREFGNTGLFVSALGFGAGQIGDARLTEREVEVLLNAVLDQGVTLIDTARGYGLSEERIGQYLSRRRHEFVLSTKVGYGIPGYADWTYDCIIAGIDAALQRLQTDVIDIVHLHSCTIETLRDGAIMDALDEARRQGKLRVAAYSGENEALDFAIASGRFQSIETSINLCDQRGIDRALPRTIAQHLGVIAKRPVANAPWRFAQRPIGDYAEEYWLRWRAMNIDPRGFDWQELASRFTAYLPGVHSCITGTTNLDHFQRNAAFVAKGPLPADLIDVIRQTFKANDQDWIGQV